MASTGEVQALLRFLSKDAKVTLAVAMASIKQMQTAGLVSPETIVKADIKVLEDVFKDQKVAKQVLTAAKRVSKKRTSSAASGSDLIDAKKIKPLYGEPPNAAQSEETLALPQTYATEEELRKTIVFTNRAPLMLAVVVTLLKYTMPSQPLSSRLSLAQAVVSMNSRSKAVSIGLESGKSADEEGFGEGQPRVRVMGREVRVLKRWGYDWKTEGDTQSSSQTVLREEEPALWALDLEALKRSNAVGQPGIRTSSTGQLPIYTPQSARAYLLKSFDGIAQPEGNKKKPTQVQRTAQLETNLAHLLAALDILCQSWSNILDASELDKRAWSWYLKVRPNVQGGVAGWGGKSNVKLADILDLKRIEESQHGTCQEEEMPSTDLGITAIPSQKPEDPHPAIQKQEPSDVDRGIGPTQHPEMTQIPDLLPTQDAGFVKGTYVRTSATDASETPAPSATIPYSTVDTVILRVPDSQHD